jgi:hypothetical protein
MHQCWTHLAKAIKIVVWLVPNTGHPNAAVTQKAAYALRSHCHLQDSTTPYEQMLSQQHSLLQYVSSSTSLHSAS